MTQLNFQIDLESMIKSAVNAEIARMVAHDTGYGPSVRKDIGTLVVQSFGQWKHLLTEAISQSVAQAAKSPELIAQISKQAVGPIANAVVGGMGNTCVELGRNLGRDPKFCNALLDHVRDSIVPKEAPALHEVSAALSQASFALRELLPNDPDAKMTVEMIISAQVALKKARGGKE